MEDEGGGEFIFDNMKKMLLLFTMGVGGREGQRPHKVVVRFLASSQLEDPAHLIKLFRFQE